MGNFSGERKKRALVKNSLQKLSKKNSNKTQNALKTKKRQQYQLAGIYIKETEQNTFKNQIDKIRGLGGR